MIDPEDLAGPPTGDGATAWAYGVVVPGVLAAYGLFCVFTGHAKVPNIKFGAIQPAGLGEYGVGQPYR
jgi:hypothetical protein